MAEREHYRLDFLSDHVAPGRLIEVGPGNGVFALMASGGGWDVTTIEADEGACERLRSAVGVKAVHSDAPERVLARESPSRAIIAWHAIEHLPHPAGFLAEAARNLEPGGLLVIATPNVHAVQFRLLRSQWPHVDAPRHLQLIPAGALAEVCTRLGLESVLVTTRDPGGRYWDRFGWGHAVVPLRKGWSRFAAAAVGLAMTSLLGPLEKREMKGAAYTAVFRRPCGESTV